MTPALLLAILAALTVAAVLADRIARVLRQRRLRRLALAWRMQYSPQDRTNLAQHVAPLLTVPGTADLRIADVMYARQDDGYAWLCTLHYTIGVTRTQRRLARAALLLEPPEGSGRLPELRLCQLDIALVDQYEALHDDGLKAG